ASLHAAAASVAAVASAAQAAKESPSNLLQSTAQSNAPHTKPQKLVTWLAESEINIEDIINCTQEIISIYEVWEQYNEKTCKEQIARFVKARGLDK
ncbi:MAG: RNA polymerase II holoenzyme cyclin-like subunit, partial [Pleopsidium flavum]